MIKTKNNPITTDINPFIKIASHMTGLNYYAVAQDNYVKVSYNIREYENYCVMLSNPDVKIDPLCNTTQIILTDCTDPDKYITEKNSILYVSKHLGKECICEIIKYHLKIADKNTRISKYVTKILLELGIPTNRKGYYYLKTSIELVIKSENLFSQEIMNLYSEVARLCHTNADCIERSIRTAIETVYYKNSKRFENFFDYPVGKPQNSELINLIAEKVKLLID